MALESQPTLSLASPEGNTTILGDRVTVDFTVGGVVLTDYQRVPEKRVGLGHVHIWLDSPSAKTETAIHYFRHEPFTFQKVPEGEHTLIIEVVQNDHTSFSPPVAQLVSFKTSLPKEVTMQIQERNSPTTSPVAGVIISNNWLPLLIALLCINLGILWWLWSIYRSRE